MTLILEVPSILITYSSLISRHLWQNLVHKVLWAICRNLQLSSAYLDVIPWTRPFRFLPALEVICMVLRSYRYQAILDPDAILYRLRVCFIRGSRSRALCI